MAPVDFLDMLSGYNWRQRRREAERDSQNYLLRTIAVTTINAHVKKGDSVKPSELFPIPSIDKPRTNRGKLRKASDELFRRARKNGNLK
jgi:hypothetical protein